MAPRRSKRVLVDELIRVFRASTNQDLAFEKLAAVQLGVNETDLHCMNIIQNSGGLPAGELAALSGLSAGAVTGVIDRLERTGFARRVPDASDRRRVIVEVTPAFYERAERIWGPLAADWRSTLTGRFTANELRRITDFLHAADDLSRRHLGRLRQRGDAGAGMREENDAPEPPFPRSAHGPGAHAPYSSSAAEPTPGTLDH